mgnify:FL=1
MVANDNFNSTSFEKLTLIDSLENLELPLAGVFASCGFTGFPSPAMEYEEKAINVGEVLGIKKNKTWIFKTSGDSLKDCGILDGDFLVVDSSINPQLGHLCICVVGGEYVAKFVELIDNKPHLVSANNEYKPIPLNLEDTFQIFGVVTGRFSGQLNGIKRH